MINDKKATQTAREDASQQPFDVVVQDMLLALWLGLQNTMISCSVPADTSTPSEIL